MAWCSWYWPRLTEPVPGLSRFRQQLHMRHTPWIDRCAEILREKPEFQTDAAFESYVNVQWLMRRNQVLFDDIRRGPTHQKSAVWEQIIELTTKVKTEDLLNPANAPRDCKSFVRRRQLRICQVLMTSNRVPAY
ncbi:uncharacterized protein BDV17DRAFT_248505 [Aspergillus undulatus]|uniref:uncharacterized protein n=1 Tax=Aspergillus undulatus TaxID=1810928 RepID=UPI003CCE3398